MNAQFKRTLAAIEESVATTDYRVAAAEYQAETARLRAMLHLATQGELK